MKKPSDVFKSIRYAKMEPQHDKGHAGGSTDDEEHGAIGEKEWGEQLKHAKKRAMMNTEEVKDKTDIGEYDQEGDMAKSDLRSIIANAQKLHDMIDDADNLPEWVQSKITLAEDYISTVANYMNSEMNEEVVQEGRPSQRHPLEGHEYHKKTNAELEYIAKDAHKAAEAMKSHNTTAENKYRDQANDSATVRYYRQKHGMADWYKKKYGHMKEDFSESKEEKTADVTHKGPAANELYVMRQIAKEKETTPPFDGPYKKAVGTVTDKSGAKHTPMSRARDLARNAALKQAQSMKKESLEESRKAEIVKETFKKAKTKKSDDTFQSEPELGSSVVKSDN